MINIIEIKGVNTITRIITGILLMPLIFLLILLILSFIKQKLNHETILEYFGYYILFQTIWLIGVYNKVKYYIISININNNQIFFKYYKWFKIINIQAEMSNVSMKLDVVRAMRFRFFINNKKIITQVEPTLFLKSEWNGDLLKEVETKLKPYLKIQKTL